MSRKVILFIVEGYADVKALSKIFTDCIETDELLVELYQTGGDILTDWFKPEIDVKARVDACLKDFLKRNPVFKRKDIVRIVQITDMDGAYVSNEKIMLDGKREKVYYDDDCIWCRNPEKIKNRNLTKQAALYKLVNTGIVSKDIPYSIYYMSCNLDHVLYDERNLPDSDKVEKAKEFELKFGDNISDVKQFFHDRNVPVKSFKDSWDFIEEGNHSLTRFTNIEFLLYEIGNEDWKEAEIDNR